jgi:shikimate dehydrogenase
VTVEAGVPDQYGVAGHPVDHSWSPFIHGMFATKCEQHLVYRRYDIPPENFRREALRLLTSGVKGLNITLPHKMAAAELVNTLTPRAARAEAVNTIVMQEDHTLLGDNTDGVGLVRDLCDNLGLDPRNKRILILGAGGAARGILAPLIETQPAALVIANRTVSRARALASSFQDLYTISPCEFRTVSGPPYDLIINATSASLQGQMPDLPPGLVSEHSICYDLTYGKGHTPFTLWAKSLYAARVYKGWGMLVEQAAESFFLWRGIRPETHSVLEALTRKS